MNSDIDVELKALERYEKITGPRLFPTSLPDCVKVPESASIYGWSDGTVRILRVLQARIPTEEKLV